MRWLVLGQLAVLAAGLEAAAVVGGYGVLSLALDPGRVRTAPFASQIWQAWPTDDPPAIVLTLAAVVAGLVLLRLAVGWLIRRARRIGGPRRADTWLVDGLTFAALMAVLVYVVPPGVLTLAVADLLLLAAVAAYLVFRLVTAGRRLRRA